MHDYPLIRDRFKELKSERDYAISALKRENVVLQSLKQEEEDSLTARIIIQQCADETQQQLKATISSLVTLCTNVVFPDDDIVFDVEISQKRGRTEACFFIVKDGKRIDDLLDADGGGLADIISIALRIAFIKLSKNKFRCLLLDEPTKFLHDENAQARTNEMLMRVSEDLKIQFVIISDQPELIGHKKFVVNRGVVKEITC